VKEGDPLLVTILGEQDAEQYWKLRLEALKKSPEAFSTSYEEAEKRENPIEQTAKQLASDDSVTFGAFEDDELVGMTTLMLSNRDKTKHKAFIVGMYVQSEYRQKGIGRQLMFKAVNTARRLGHVEQLQLDVVSSNLPAVKLYEAIGFSKYGTEPKAIKVDGAYYDADLMVMTL
jgi:ribosomal protein S18 acetylase RimI-like enzyme